MPFVTIRKVRHFLTSAHNILVVMRTPALVYVVFAVSVLSQAAYSVPVTCSVPLRSKTFDLKEFGGVNDGKTLNTQAFVKAMQAVRAVRRFRLTSASQRITNGLAIDASDVFIHTVLGRV